MSKKTVEAVRVLTDEEEEAIRARFAANDTGLWATLFIAFLATGGEVYILLYFTHDYISMLELGIFHLCIGLILCVWCGYYVLRKRDLRLPLLTLVFTMSMGPFGSGIAVFSILFYVSNKRAGLNFLQWYQDLFPQNERKHSENIYERIIYGLDKIVERSSIEPFKDVLAFGTLQQKQMALAKITRHFRPNFAPALLQAIDDPSNAVRVQAATAIAKIEHSFMEKYLSLEKDVAHDPTNIKKMKSFGKLCDEYAHCGILDPDRKNQSWNKSIEMYTKVASLAPDDEETKLALGRLYLRNNRPQEAYEWLHKVVEKGGLATPNIVTWYMESLFLTHQYDKLHATAKAFYPQLPDQAQTYSRIRNIVELWKDGVPEEKLKLGVSG